MTMNEANRNLTQATATANSSEELLEWCPATRKDVPNKGRPIKGTTS